MKKLKLNLGCGGDLKEGYINIDLYEPLFITNDGGRQFLGVNIMHINNYFAANSVDEILASHVFEHLTHYEVTTLLFKLWGILAPRGELTIITPDFYQIMLSDKEKRLNGDFSDVDILHLKVFSTEDETLHRSVWYKELGNWYLTREGLFETPVYSKPSDIECCFYTRKV